MPSTILEWAPVPRNLSILPVDVRILTVDEYDIIRFAEYDGDELWIYLNDTDDEEDEVEPTLYAIVEPPEQ